MAIKVIVLDHVARFIDSLEVDTRADLYRLIGLLQEYGHALPIPYAKPIGHGLWELRKTGQPQVRILYGFCKSEAVLVHAFKKQRSALKQSDISLALKRLAAYCR